MSRFRLATVSMMLTCIFSGSLAAEPAATGRVVRDGVAVEFEARPVGDATELVEGQLANIRFRISDADSGTPVEGLVPGAWLDLAQGIAGKDGEQKECKDKISLYLKGVVGMRPLVDLNSYYLMVLNKDPSITVIDPLMSMAGVTSTLTRITLKRPPIDWVMGADGKRLFVSMPVADEVAVVDTAGFKVLRDVEAGDEPVRVAIQPDGRYLWVGNDSRDPDKSGVTVIDADSLKRVAQIRTGQGHHEIAFSADSRHAFVTNRSDGSVSAIDISKLQKVRDLKVGSQPMSIATSALSKALYVADGESGTITVVDAKTLKTRKVIQARRGIGPLRFTHDGRYAFALNTLEGIATVVDAGSDEVVHDIEVSAEPYQVSFTESYAYVRGLASEKVTLVNLASLGKGREPIVQAIAAGDAAPKLAGDLPLADSVATRTDESSVFIVNPATNTTYFYMEGMNAPMAGYLNRGHTSRAVTVVDRAMRESQPGVFSTQVMLPASGRFDVAFMLDRPQVLHCFSAEVKPGQASQGRLAAPRLEFLRDGPASVGVPSQQSVRFRLVQGQDDEPRSGVTDLRASYFLAPTGRRRDAPVSEVGEGVYEARLDLAETGAYYVYVDSSVLGEDGKAQQYMTLRATRGAKAGE